MQIPLAQKSSGMYLFSNKDFDNIAELMLEEYAPYMLEKAQPLDIEALADEAYSLTIIDRYISARGTVLGLISFNDYKMQLISLDKKVQEEIIMSGTIVLDASLLPEKQHHRRRFTISHEVAHWIIHRQMYYPDVKACCLKTSGSYIVCREISSLRSSPRGCWSEQDWQEWQADKFASAMLMPASVFYPTALAVLKKYHAGSYIIDGCGSKEAVAVVTELAEIFDVSRTAVRIRLRQAGYLRSLGVYCL